MLSCATYVRVSRVRVRVAICYMNCLNPISVYIDPFRDKRANGKQLFSFNPKNGMKAAFQLPCGKCILCRDGQRKQWINRLILESLDNDSSFLTLTLNEDNYLPPIKKPIQDFLKRFRITCKRRGVDLSRFKYFIVNEYGKKRLRLHYHCIFFGVDLLRNPVFETYLATTKIDNRGRRFPVYSSRFIERIWSFGFNSVDRCTDRSIRYVAKYCSKVSPVGDDKESQAMFPQWKLFSQRIGCRPFLVGKRLTSFGKQVFSSGKLLLSRDGFPSRPPRFLDRYADLYEHDLYESVKASRRAFVRNFKQDVGIVRGRASNILSNLTAQLRNQYDEQ